MDHNNETLVQDFVAEPGVFFLGIKSLNLKSVAAARNRDQVLPVVGRHLYREIYAETCWNGGRVDRSRSSLNFSLLPDAPMKSEVMVEAALAAVANNGMDWAKLRKDKIVGIELVISLPVAFQGDVRAFFVESLAWVRAMFPAPIMIVAAVVHMDEATPHMHVILVPIVAPGVMDGHQVAGYKAVHNKRLNSFHQQVAQRYGLRKPRPKVRRPYRERQQLAERVLATILADGTVWTNSPAGVMAMRQTLALDPTWMAKALGLLEEDDDATQSACEGVGAAVLERMADGASTAFLCNAVSAEAVLDGADNDVDDRANVHAAQMDKSAHLSLDPHSPHGPIYVDNYTEDAAPDLGHDDASTPTDTVAPQEFVRERESEHPVSTWVEELGCHGTLPLPKPSNRTKADEDIARALETLYSRRLNPNKENQ